MRIERLLPGELEDDIKPEEYGFGVIRITPPTAEEAADILRSLYDETKQRTGVVMPRIERHLAQVGTAEGAGSREEPDGGHRQG